MIGHDNVDIDTADEELQKWLTYSAANSNHKMQADVLELVGKEAQD